MGNAQSLSNKVDEISVDTLETEPSGGNIVHTPLHCHTTLSFKISIPISCSRRILFSKYICLKSTHGALNANLNIAVGNLSLNCLLRLDKIRLDKIRLDSTLLSPHRVQVLRQRNAV